MKLKLRTHPANLGLIGCVLWLIIVAILLAISSMMAFYTVLWFFGVMMPVWGCVLCVVFLSQFIFPAWIVCVIAVSCGAHVPLISYFKG